MDNKPACTFVIHCVLFVNHSVRHTNVLPRFIQLYMSNDSIKTVMALSRSMCITSKSTLCIVIQLWDHETVMPLNHNCCFAVYYKSHQNLQLNYNHSHSFQCWVHKIHFNLPLIFRCLIFCYRILSFIIG